MRFQDEVKIILYHFLRAIIEENKAIFLEGESPALNPQINQITHSNNQHSTFISFFAKTFHQINATVLKF